MPTREIGELQAESQRIRSESRVLLEASCRLENECRQACSDLRDRKSVV